jgi:PPM family protein phosphatase
MCAMRVEAVAQTDVGRVRNHNEDHHRVEPELGLYVVCDGMGGQAAGEVASALAADAFVKFLHGVRARLASLDTPAAVSEAAELLRAGVRAASKTVFDQAGAAPGRHGMGTTLVALLLRGDKGLVAHVGDSRLYLLRDGRVSALTEDHSFRAEVVRSGVMTAAEAAKSPHGHLLTRAVGVAPSVQPDVLAFDVLPGDVYLLCSDGLHDALGDGALLAEAVRAPSLAQATAALVQAALEGGGRDNVTAILLRTRDQSERERARKESVSRGFEALRELELFRDLEMAELVRLYGTLSTQYVRAGECVVREGEGQGGLYVVLEGEFEVARGGKPVARLGRGSHFGEMSLLNQRPRSATVIATCASTLLCLPPRAFEGLLTQEPRLASKVLLKLAQTLSLRLDDAYLARDQRRGRSTLGLGEYPAGRRERE